MNRRKNVVVFDEFNRIQYSDGGKYVREQNRLATLAKKTDHAWGSGAHFSERKGRYVRMHRGKASSYIKRMNNRQLRRDRRIDGPIRQKGIHKKLTEFWYELY